MKKIDKRWRVVLGGVLCQFCIGMLYCWSIYQNPLKELFNTTTQQVSVAFSISTFMFPIAMIIAGKFLTRYGPTKIAIVGGLLLLMGMLVSWKAVNLEMLYLGFGLLGGLGVGTVYGVPIATCVKWFPDRKGMISGLAIAGFGVGSMAYAPIARRLIALCGPLNTFLFQGVVSIIGITLGAVLLKTAPDGYCPEGWIPPKEVGVASSRDYTSWQMLRTKWYWLLLCMYILANATGLMLVGHASPIGQQIAGLSAAQAAGVVSILSLSNTVGRFCGGIAVDKFGNFPVLVILYIMMSAGMFSMCFMTAYFPYAVTVAVVAFCFGAMVGDFPTIVLDFFGNRHYAANYGFMFLAFGIGGVAGPQIASWILDVTNGNYIPAFIFFGVLCLLGAAVTELVKHSSKQRKPSA